MYQPAFEDFQKLAGKAGIIPVFREIIADLDTPLTVFAKVAGEEHHAFLLESLEGGEKWGRYSFIGFDPILTFESFGERVEIKRGDVVERRQGDPLELLQEVLESFKVGQDNDFLPRFYGGAVGYLGYDMVRFMEKLPEMNPPQDVFPDSSFMIPRLVLIFDNFRQTLTIVNCVETDGSEDPEALYRAAQNKIDSIEKTPNKGYKQLTKV